MRAQRGEGAGCFGVVGGKIQQLEDVPLFPYGAKAFGVNQFKHKRGMPDCMVGRSPSPSARPAWSTAPYLRATTSGKRAQFFASSRVTT